MKRHIFAYLRQKKEWLADRFYQLSFGAQIAVIIFVIVVLVVFVSCIYAFVARHDVVLW